MKKDANPSSVFSLRAISSKVSSKFNSAVDFALTKDDSKLEKLLEEEEMDAESVSTRLPQFCAGADWRIRGFYQPAFEVDIVSSSLSSARRVKKHSNT